MPWEITGLWKHCSLAEGVPRVVGRVNATLAEWKLKLILDIKHVSGVRAPFFLCVNTGPEVCLICWIKVLRECAVTILDSFCSTPELNLECRVRSMLWKSGSYFPIDICYHKKQLKKTCGVPNAPQTWPCVINSQWCWACLTAFLCSPSHALLMNFGLSTVTAWACLP